MAKVSHRNEEWNLDSEFSWNHANLGMLMDIRAELRTLNRLLGCANFQAIPRKLDRISHNTAKPRKKKPRGG